MDKTCGTCLDLLNEALNLVVRARQMDAIDRRESMLACSVNPEGWQADGTFDRFVERYNLEPTNAHRPIEPRCLTQQIWVIDQYEKDLHDWEGRARSHLMNVPHTPKEPPHAG